MTGPSFRTLSGRLRLAFAVSAMLSFVVVTGSLRSDARPGARGQSAPRAAATATILHNFNTTVEGNAPQYGLVQGPDGSLYGVTTQTAGTNAATNNVGIVFKVAPNGTGFTVLHTFGTNINDGYQPGAKLLLDGGLLLGTCTTGGGDSNQAGTLFVIDPSQVKAGDNTAGYSVLHYFQNTVVPSVNGSSELSPNTTDGAQPNGSLFLASDGSIYGTTYGPSANGTGGTIFHLQPDSSGHFSVTAPDANKIYQFGGTYTTIYNFNGGVLTPNPANGANPLGGVIQLSDGFLYGTTYQGGSAAGTSGNTTNFGYGTVYKIAPDGTGFTILHSFTGPIKSDSTGITSVGDGESPECDLIQASDGKPGMAYLYGTTYFGGSGGSGTVFQIKPDTKTGIFDANSPFGTIASLNANNTGAEIAGGVIQASDGNLYGTTLSGGANGSGNGSVFQITPNPSSGTFDAAPDPLTYNQSFPDPFNTIYTFLGASNPQSLTGPLIQGLDGRLYGESINGGQLADGSGAGGTVFAISAGLPVPVVPIVVSSVSGTLNPPEVTTASEDAVLTVHGQNFNGAEKVSIDGQSAPVTGQTSTQITVTLPAPLSAGTHSLVVADAGTGGRASSPLSFTVTLLNPQITQVTNGSGGAVTSIDTKIVIHGNSFAAGDGVNFSSVYKTATLTEKVDNGGQITVTLSQGLPVGGEKITVTRGPLGNQVVSNEYDFTVQAGPAPAIISVTGDSSPPAVTTNDTTLTVHGTGFANGDSVVIGGTTASATIAGQDLSDLTDEKITVTLSQTLSAGQYTATVTHAAPDGRSSAPFTFTVASAPRPTISTVSYFPTLDTVAIVGSGFAPGAVVSLANFSTGASFGPFTASISDSTGISVNVGLPLPAGAYGVLVTNPDKHAVGGSLYVLGITSADYDVHTLAVTIQGAGIDPSATVTVDGKAVGSPTISPTFDQISLTLSSALSGGSHTVDVTNPDGQKAGATLTVVNPTSLYTRITNSAAVNEITITPNDGFNGSLSDLQINHPDPASNFNNLSALQATSHAVRPKSHARVSPRATGGYPVILSAAAETDLGQSVSQIVIIGSDFVGSGSSGTTVTLDGQTYTADAASTFAGSLLINVPLGLDPSAKHFLSVTNSDGKSSQNFQVLPTAGHFLSASNGGAFVSNPIPVSSYKVSFSERQIVGPHVGIGAMATSPAGSIPQSTSVGGGTGLIGPKGTTIGAVGSGTLIAQDGSGLLASGSSVISNDGGSIMAAGGALINQDGSGIVAAGGGNLTGGDVFTGTSSASGGARPAAPAATARATATHAVADPGHMDLSLFVSNAQSGQSMTLLTIRYTPGQPDIILYQAPGVTVTPVNGTPAPQTALHTFAPGLQMIAAPQASTWDAPAGQVVDTWAGGPAYLTGTALPAPGQGAWVHPTADVHLLSGGTLVLNSAVSIPLSAGWNLIGDPFSVAASGSGMMVSDARGGTHTLSDANLKGLVYTTLYTYPAGAAQYQTLGLLGGSLAPYQGYWLYAFQPCTLLVPAPLQGLAVGQH